MVTVLFVSMGISYNIFAEDNKPAWVKVSRITTKNKPIINPSNPKGKIVSTTDSYECLVEPHSLVEIGTREEGVIDQLHVKRGDIVKKNQPIIKLESGLEELTVKLARARVRMKSDIAAKKTTLDYHSRQLKRIDNLWKKKVISFSDKDKADTDVLLSKTDLNNAKENMALTIIEKDRVEHMLNRRTIFSPIDGVVVELFLDKGESVVESKPIMSIAEIDPLNIEIVLPLEQFGLIKVGDFAEVTPIIPGGTTKKIKVTIVDRVIDAASNTFGVRLLLPNPSYKIPGGIRCNIKFLTEQVVEINEYYSK